MSGDQTPGARSELRPPMSEWTMDFCLTLRMVT